MSTFQPLIFEEDVKYHSEIFDSAESVNPKVEHGCIDSWWRLEIV